MRKREVGNGSAQEFYPIVRLPFLVLNRVHSLMITCSYRSRSRPIPQMASHQPEWHSGALELQWRIKDGEGLPPACSHYPC